MNGLTWPAATTQAALMASNWVLFVEVGLGVAVFVWGLILFAALRWRRRSENAVLPPQFRTNSPLEIAWTVVPLLVVLVLFVHTYHAEAGVEALQMNPDTAIYVNGYRWGWTFAYRAGPTFGGSPANPPQLVLPGDRTTRIVLTSSDVNHAFWIPAFLFKRDAIPGLVNTFDLHPTRLGTYVGHCAEFCGYNHALMGFSVKVIPASDFLRWQRGGAL